MGWIELETALRRAFEEEEDAHIYCDEGDWMASLSVTSSDRRRVINITAMAKFMERELGVD